MAQLTQLSPMGSPMGVYGSFSDKGKATMPTVIRRSPSTPEGVLRAAARDSETKLRRAASSTQTQIRRP